VNLILQAQPGFHSPYEGDNSLRPHDHSALSVVGTVFAGYELTSTTTILVTGESAGGGGLSDALGVAGFTNLDVVRNPSLGPAPYIGRAYIDQVIPLGDSEKAERAPLRIFHRMPSRRLEIRAGKVSTVDFFDVNTVLINLTISLFTAILAVSNFVVGPLADARGRRAVLLPGLLVFSAGSAVCLLAPSYGWFLGGRAIQACGISTALLVAPTVIGDVFAPQERAHAKKTLLLPPMAPLLQRLLTYVNITLSQA
jgi:hypothetical protein